MHSLTNLQRRIVRIESKILMHGKNGFAEILHLHKKNDFAEGSKIFPDTNLKIILLNDQNNFVETLKIMSNAAKNVNIPTISCV